MNHHLLYLFAKAVSSRITGHRIGTVRYLRPILSVPLSARGDSICLVVLTSSPGPYCFTAAEAPLAEAGVPVFKRIQGERVRAVSVAPADRILRVELDGGLVLAVSLFGNASKVRVESGGTIVDSLSPDEPGREVERFTAREPARFPALEPPFHLVAGNGPRTAAPGAAGPGAMGPFDDALEACQAVGEPLFAEACRGAIERQTGPIRRYLEGRKKLVAHLESELREAEDVGRERAEANTLAAYQSQIKPGARSVTLPDLYGSGARVTIALDPSRSIEEEIARRYRRVAKLERSAETIRERIVAIEAEMRHARRELARIEKEPVFDRAAVALAALGEALRPPQRRRPPKGPAQRSRTYRRFELGDGWFVLVGRSNKENDEITFRVAAPTDIWMHAQGVAGSHVILKSTGTPGNPPEGILEQAAAVAAHYSKAKHSSLVPVIYTQRKYVRKPRGSKPGQVVCEREKTIFAKPQLPPGESK